MKNQNTSIKNLDNTTNKHDSDINSLDSTVKEHTTNINTLDNKTKLNIGVNSEQNIIKNFLRRSFGLWKFRDTPINDASYIRGIGVRETYSYYDNEPVYIAVTNNSEIITSVDSGTWTLVDNTLFNSSKINDVVAGIRKTSRGFRWLSVGDSGKIGISSDGNNWSLVTEASGVFGTTNLHGVEFGYDDSRGELWVIVGYDGTIGYSPEITGGSANWQSATWDGTAPTTEDFYRVKCGYDYDIAKDLWIAVGSQKLLAKSSDGKTWKKLDMSSISSINVSINSVAYEDGIWIICTSSGKILTSLDGTNWSIKLDLDDGSPIDFYDIAYGDGRWIVAGYDTDKLSAILAISIDGGETWTMEPSYSDPVSHKNTFRGSIIYSIKYHNGNWVAGGENSKLASGYIFWD